MSIITTTEDSTTQQSLGELVLRIRGTNRDGQIVRMRSEKCTIGSSSRCTLRLKGRGIQSLHCLILRGQAATIVRCWSSDTRLNGRTFGEAELVASDRLSVGPIDFEVVGLNVLPDERSVATRTEVPSYGLQHAPNTEGFEEAEKLKARLAESNLQARRRMRRLIDQLRTTREEVDRLRSKESDPSEGEVDSSEEAIRAVRAELAELRKTLGEKQQFSEREQLLEQQAKEHVTQNRDLEARWEDLHVAREQWNQEQEQLRVASQEQLNQIELHSSELELLRKQLEEERNLFDKERSESNLPQQVAELESREAALEAQQEELLKKQRQNLEAENELQRKAEELESHKAALEAQQEELLKESRQNIEAENELQREAALEAQQEELLKESRQNLEAERLEAESELQRKAEELESREAALEAQQEELLKESRQNIEAERLEAESELQRKAEELESREAALEAQQEELLKESRQKLEAERLEAESELQRKAEELESREAALEAQQEELLKEPPPSEEDTEPQEEDTEPQEEDTEPQEEDTEPQEEDTEPQEEDTEPQEEDTEPQEVGYEAISTDSPTSTQEILERMGTMPGLSDAEEAYEPSSGFPEQDRGVLSQDERGTGISTHQDPAPPTPLGEPPSEDGEESIDDYMARLLERVQRECKDEPVSSSPALSPQIEPKETRPPQPIAPPQPITPPEPIAPPEQADSSAPMRQPIPVEQSGDVSEESVEMSPRAVAPERSLDMKAMREVAKISASTAIDTHSRQVLDQTIFAKLLVMIVGIATGLGLLFLWWIDNTNWIALISGITAISVATLWGFQYLGLLKQIIFGESK